MLIDLKRGAPAPSVGSFLLIQPLPAGLLAVASPYPDRWRQTVVTMLVEYRHTLQKLDGIYLTNASLILMLLNLVYNLILCPI